MNFKRAELVSPFPIISKLGPATIYILVFFITPIAVFFVYSFWSVSQWEIIKEWTFDNYYTVLTSPVFTLLIFRSIVIGLVTATLSVIVVYPLAYAMVFKFEKYRDLILFLLAISLFSNYLVRIYAWKSILSSNGLVNYLATQMGLVNGPMHYLIYSQWGVVVVLLNVYIPFATLPIYSSLLNVERETIDAAADLGAGPFRTFCRITLPLSISGVIVSFLFIFLLAAGDFVTPQLVGGKSGMMIGNAVATQFGIVCNWPLGSAMVFSTIGIIAAILAAGFLLLQVVRKARRKILTLSLKIPPPPEPEDMPPSVLKFRGSLSFSRMPLLQMYAVLTLFFLFLPVFILVVLSFNKNITGVFPLEGFTLDWYREAFNKRIIWPALENSVRVAAGTALISALLGTPAAFALTRYSFRFRNALRTLLSVPISMPTLLIGISLLSFFAFFAISRSLITVIIGHVVYCVPYMVLAVSARLQEFDFSVEEAAHDLGATPFRAFRMVIFPLIRPTVVGAMLLIFSLSFNMFVITYFNIGAQSTLPMVIWSMLRSGIDPSLNALATMVIAVSIGLLFLANRFGAIKLGV